MTEDSQGRMRDYDPFAEDTEPPAPNPRPGAHSAGPDADRSAGPDAGRSTGPDAGRSAGQDASRPEEPDPYGTHPPYGPFHGTPAPASGVADSYGLSTLPGRRIEPSPPPQRGRLLPGILAGLLAGLILFGTAGFFTGRATAPDPTRAATGANGTNGTNGTNGGSGTNSGNGANGPSLGVFEQNQLKINQPDFAGTGLTTIAQGWLPYLSTCSRSGSLGAGEKVKVRCTLDGMSAIFVEYSSTADRDKARAKAIGQGVDAARLAPGVAPASRRAAPSGRTSGNYTEYAYRLTEGGVTRTVSGIWWDDARTPVAGYLLAYWTESVGESWDPLRDLWSRYA